MTLNSWSGVEAVVDCSSLTESGMAGSDLTVLSPGEAIRADFVDTRDVLQGEIMTDLDENDKTNMQFSHRGANKILFMMARRGQ